MRPMLHAHVLGPRQRTILTLSITAEPIGGGLDEKGHTIGGYVLWKIWPDGRMEYDSKHGSIKAAAGRAREVAEAAGATHGFSHFTED